MPGETFPTPSNTDCGTISLIHSTNTLLSMYYVPSASSEQIQEGAALETPYLLAVGEGRSQEPKVGGRSGVRGQDQDTRVFCCWQPLPDIRPPPF